jgi:hypothetical protein
MHLAGAQVANLPRAQAPDARMADPHAAAVGKARARLLASHEDRLLAVARGLDAARAEADHAAASTLSVPHAGVGLKALHMQAPLHTLALIALAHGLEHPSRAAQEGLAPRPIRAQLVELIGGDATMLAGEAQVQAVAQMVSLQLAQLAREDDLLGAMCAMHVNHIGQRLPGGEAAQHAHDRRNAAAGTDEQELRWQRVGQHECSFHAPESHDRAGAHAPEEER